MTISIIGPICAYQTFWQFIGRLRLDKTLFVTELLRPCLVRVLILVLAAILVYSCAVAITYESILLGLCCEVLIC